MNKGMRMQNVKVIRGLINEALKDLNDLSDARVLNAVSCLRVAQKLFAENDKTTIQPKPFRTIGETL